MILTRNDALGEDGGGKDCLHNKKCDESEFSYYYISSEEFCLVNEMQCTKKPCFVRNNNNRSANIALFAYKSSAFGYNSNWANAVNATLSENWIKISISNSMTFRFTPKKDKLKITIGNNIIERKEWRIDKVKLLMKGQGWIAQQNGTSSEVDVGNLSEKPCQTPQEDRTTSVVLSANSSLDQSENSSLADQAHTSKMKSKLWFHCNLFGVCLKDCNPTYKNILIAIIAIEMLTFFYFIFVFCHLIAIHKNG